MVQFKGSLFALTVNLPEANSSKFFEGTETVLICLYLQFYIGIRVGIILSKMLIPLTHCALEPSPFFHRNLWTLFSKTEVSETKS